MRFSRMLIFLLIALAFLQAAHFAPLLPERVASHFGADGQADGWSSKTSFLATQLGFVVGMALLFLGVTALVHRVPNDWINMPHKDYWLAPERRAGTLNTLGQQMDWLSAATLALLLGIGQLTIQANLAKVPALPDEAFWLIFGSFMVVMAVWLVLLLLKWYTPPPRRDDQP